MSTINFPLQKTLLYAASSTWHPDTLQMLHLDNCYTGIKRHALSHLSSRSKKCFPNISRNLSVSIGNPTRNFSVSLPNFPTPEQEMENAARLRHGAGLYRDQTIETGTLSVLSFWHLQHCDTLTTCSSLLKECLLSPTDGIMSKDASSASQWWSCFPGPVWKHYSKHSMFDSKRFIWEMKILWILREMSFGLFSGANCLWKPKCWIKICSKLSWPPSAYFHPDFTHFTFSDGDIWSSADNWRESLHPSGHNHQAQNIQTY